MEKRRETDGRGWMWQKLSFVFSAWALWQIAKPTGGVGEFDEGKEGEKEGTAKLEKATEKEQILLPGEGMGLE